MNAALALIAVVPVRDGILPAGGLDSISEARGTALLIGSGCPEAGESVRGVARRVFTVEVADPSSAVLGRVAAEAIRQSLPDHSVVVPASPDGRDLAPHLALALGRPLHSGAIEIRADEVRLARQGGLAIAPVRVDGPFVATLQPGIRGVDSVADATLEHTALAISSPVAGHSVVSVEVRPPDASTMDLAEAPRIVGGGAGLDSGERFAMLADVAAALDASMGVTRVITDRGWATHERQIGTTGVVVDPQLYIAFGISGAVQHTSGLGQPAHIISVNTDPHCPMMQMADLAIVADANQVLAALAHDVSVVSQS
ncbi:MAG: mycofactocin-associated electron transfer flavoprotein alpha subunit [Actinomycetota bacterium]